MAGEPVSSTLLLAAEGGGECEFPCYSLVALVGYLQAASCLLYQRGHLIGQAAGQDEPAVDGLLEAAQELWHLPGGDPQPLPLIEQRVLHRRGMLEGCQERRRQFGQLQPDPGSEPGMNNGSGANSVTVVTRGGG